MNPAHAQNIKSVVDPMIKREHGNIILIVASSETGKSTILAQVLFDIFKMSNGFLTTFMSPSYDSLPIQKMILENLTEKRKIKKSTTDNPLGFTMADLYKTKEWLFTKRGWDALYCRFIYNMRLRLYKNYGEADKVREFRFVLALDDCIDIGGSLIREICLTWRNKGISWIQLVQDITNLDCAVRNSAPIVFFGHMNFPIRRRQICEEYLAPYIPGHNLDAKVDLYSQLTANKRFILMNHRERKCYHLDTNSGRVTEMPELASTYDDINGAYEMQYALGVDPQSEDHNGGGKKRKRSGSNASSAAPGAPLHGNPGCRSFGHSNGFVAAGHPQDVVGGGHRHKKNKHK